MMSPEEQVRQIFRKLYAAWGPQHWWPAESRFEVVLGAFLTQNTAWTNVERALANLRAADALSLAALRGMPLEELEQLVRPAGYFRQKALRIKRFIEWLDATYAGSLERMFAAPTARLREELLARHGVGPETADSILLYAGSHESFVVDAYTRRVLGRHGILPETAKYEEVRQLCERALKDETLVQITGAGEAAHTPSRASTMRRSPRAQVYNEMHGLIVSVAKKYCWKAVAKCDDCPLKPLLPRNGRS